MEDMKEILVAFSMMQTGSLVAALSMLGLMLSEEYDIFTKCIVVLMIVGLAAAAVGGVWYNVLTWTI